jgi:hypothetical protein
MSDGAYVTWTRKVECECDEEVFDLLRDMSESELETAHVWMDDWQQSGTVVLANLDKIFGE